MPVALLVFVHAGCISNRYKLAPASTPPLASLDLNASQIENPTAANSSAEISLQGVIVFRGPGSWKRDAYWDEYVLRIANPGPAPLSVDAATLTDFQAAGVTPGTDPWALEKQSRTYEKQWLSTTRYALKLGTGAVAATMGGLLGGGAAASWAGAAFGTFAAIPVFAGATIYRNVSGKHRIAAEFNSRRLVLPLTLAPGQSAHGSLFFRITPGPQRLTLRCLAGDQPPTEVVVDLAPLARLHLPLSPAAVPKP